MRQNDLEADKCNRPENLSPCPPPSPADAQSSMVSEHHRLVSLHSQTVFPTSSALDTKTLTAATSNMLQKNNVCKFNPNQKHQILNADHLSLCCKDKGSKDPSEQFSWNNKNKELNGGGSSYSSKGNTLDRPTKAGI